MGQADGIFAKGTITFPFTDWDERPAEMFGWSSDRMDMLSAELAKGESSAFMIVRDGRLIYRWGDIAFKSSVASVRKSLVNVLYGMLIAEGRIDPQQTLADFNIDDMTPLTASERKATVMDLLRARSGVYLPSVYDTANGRPDRGSHSPGAHWFYNNWDFNVLGTIVERATGENVLEALASRLVKPLRMQDCAPGDGWFQNGPESMHPVYKIQMSARDLARVGLLYLRHGRWGAKQLVPQSWVRESTRPHSEVGAGRTYGLLWWVTEADAEDDPMAVHVPMFYASGWGGQYLIVLPDIDLVIVHRSATALRAGRGVSHVQMGEILRLALSAMPQRG